MGNVVRLEREMMRKRIRAVLAEPIQAIQGGSIDPKTIAEKEAADIRLQLLLEKTHPWAASDKEQAQLACYAIVYANDRLAEIMLMEAVTKDREGNDVLSPEVELFAHELSRLALVRLEYAQMQIPQLLVVEFNEETRGFLNITSNLPVFPEYHYGYERVKPYSRNIERGTVTPMFVRTLVQAGLEIQGWANALANELGKFPADVPWQYSTLIDILRQSFMHEASDKSRRAEDLLDTLVERRLDLNILGDAYEAAYDGYADGALAYIALHCPAVLGEAWVLDRSSSE
jgi:hypothetical protein